ncbi:MAG TPA: ATP-binding protein [Candidatus Saccharimonadales bacterium]|nr:ATP-binding protein [Candidatus Saccharimonadales bacterium]
MVVDDFMFHVAKVWYRVYWGVIVFSNLLVVGGVLAARYVPAFAPMGQQYNLNSTVTLWLSGITLGYSVALYWLVVRGAESLATLIASMINTLVLLNGLGNTDAHGNAAYPYLLLWGVTVLLNGMFGPPLLIGSLLISLTYVLARSNFHISLFTTNTWYLVGTSVLAAALSYIFWGGRFISRQEQQMDKLSGMLKSNQEQSAILIQSIADGVIVTNTEGQITLTNRAAANMTGWPVDEAMGVSVEQVLQITKEDGKDFVGDEYPFKAVLIHKAFINQVLQVTSRGGKRQVISLVISPVVTKTGEVYGAVGVMRDVSEQRAAEHQRADFISTASHEMRTPVAAIEGYLALALNDKVSTIDSRARSYLEKAHSSTQHLGELFQDLLTSAKAEDGRLSNHPAVIEMGSFTEQLVEDLRFAAQKKGLQAEFVMGTGETIDAREIDTTATGEAAGGLKVVKPLYYVYADPDRLREVITNIFDNACKYTDSGKVSVGLTGNNQVVQLYVKDTGNGIPAEDIPHLFQKFYRVDNSATRTVGGTGLGLFICRKIIELYRGRIWVDSVLGKGSTFFINLPRLDATKATSLQQQAAATPPSVG